MRHYDGFMKKTPGSLARRGGSARSVAAQSDHARAARRRQRYPGGAVRAQPRDSEISTGDMLREARARSARRSGCAPRRSWTRGELVGDDVMIGIVRERLDQPDAANGFVLDGFPRTVPQAQALDAVLIGRAPLVVVDIEVPEADAGAADAQRVWSAACGTTAASGAPATGPVTRSLPEVRERPAGAAKRRQRRDVVRERLAGVRAADASRSSSTTGRVRRSGRSTARRRRSVWRTIWRADDRPRRARR